MIWPKQHLPRLSLLLGCCGPSASSHAKSSPHSWFGGNIDSMFAFSGYDPNQIRGTNAVELGSGGFCFLFAELLAAKYPASRMSRLTGPKNPFAHVFVFVGGKAADIKGFRPVRDMCFDFDIPDLHVEEVDAHAVRDHFRSGYNDDQLEAARAVLRGYIDENPTLFPAAAQVG
jgi:hypothetical protein